MKYLVNKKILEHAPSCFSSIQKRTFNCTDIAKYNLLLNKDLVIKNWCDESISKAPKMTPSASEEYTVC